MSSKRKIALLIPTLFAILLLISSKVAARELKEVAGRDRGFSGNGRFFNGDPYGRNFGGGGFGGYDFGPYRGFGPGGSFGGFRNNPYGPGGFPNFGGSGGFPNFGGPGGFPNFGGPGGFPNFGGPGGGNGGFGGGFGGLPNINPGVIGGRVP